jgi:integral membrane protein
VTGALLRYRIAAYVVGVLLLLLCVAMYLKYAQDDDGFMWIAMIHGYFYLVYLGLAFDLFRRAKWPTGVLVAMIVAGLVPGMVFAVERKVVQRGLASAGAPRDAGVSRA